MPSPFPGIDPYLESQHLWERFHARVVTYLCDALNDVSPESCVAELGEHSSKEVRDIWIEIRRPPKRAPIAVIEVLSPTNKSSDGFVEYKLKRGSAIRQRVHLVEFDFLLGGRRLPMSRPLPAGDYYALVSRAERRPDCEVYAWTVRGRLPAIPIPLSRPDPDALVDLDAVFTTAYNRGRYSRLIDYTTTPVVLRKQDDRAWAEKIARRASP
jgi:hypothetical protein